MSKRSLIALLLVGATVLGATVLREPIAAAAQVVSANIVGPLDAQGNVKVHEQGTASVDVSNASLAVTVGNLPAVQMVRDADRATLQPFAGGSDNSAVSIPDGSFNGTDTLTVPAGKRLVIEHVSGSIGVPTGQFPQLVALRTVADGVSVRHVLTVTPTTNYSGNDRFSLSQPIKMYADPGSTVTYLVNRFPADSFLGAFTWSITGYFVDA